MPDPITVTLDRAELQALLSFVPVDKLGYTPAGMRAYDAYADLERALNPDKPEQVAS